MNECEWIDETAMQLGECLSWISLQAAVDIAVDMWVDIPGRSITPREAAEIYASEAPPNELGEPGDT